MNGRAFFLDGDGMTPGVVPIADRPRNWNAPTISDTGGLIRKEAVAFVANGHEAERSSGWNPLPSGERSARGSCAS